METISQLSLPYHEVKNSNLSLNKIFFTDEGDNTRYSLILKDKQCVNTSKVISKTNEPLPEQLNYIENKNPNNSTPLLLRLPGTHNRYKLSVDVTPLDSHLSKHLILLKSKKENNDLNNLQQVLLNEASKEKEFEISKIEYADLPIDKNSEFQKVIINDKFDAKTFQNDELVISAWEYDVNTKRYYSFFHFSVWIEKLHDTNSTEFDVPPPLPEKPKPKGLLKISDLQKSFKFNIEDGPEFRQELKMYETSLPAFKRNFVAFTDEIKLLESTLKKLIASKKRVIELCMRISHSQFGSSLTKLRFHKDFEAKLLIITDPFEKNLRFFVKDICDEKLFAKIHPILNNISSENSNSNELIQAKKKFETNSKEYYNWLNKYLSNEKERPELKLLAKRINFELSKFDYLNKLNSVTNNQYINQFIENLFKFIALGFSDSDKKVLDFKTYKDPQTSQLLLRDQYKMYINALLRFNIEKFQLRQLIGASTSNEELTDLIRYNKLSYNSVLSNEDEIPEDQIALEENLHMVFSTGVGSPYNDQAVQNKEDQDSEISGILYKLGGQGKQGWHKEWVVLNKGQLIEYSDWRRGESPINKPVEVALSSTKPINYDKRHHCFEIITSTGKKHVFQAINEHERNKWIRVLYNAGQLVDTLRLNDMYKPAKDKHTKPNEPKKKLTRLVTEISEEDPMKSRSLERADSPMSIRSLKPSHNNYLSLVRSIPGDNNICVDCGSAESVEWVSINFLVCFCIQCSSCHRNLGSHISKIKSLKLDNFEGEIELLLKYINNTYSNSYLEENLDQTKKPNSSSSHEERLEFIKNKYLHKAYVSDVPQVNNLLIRAIQKIEIQNVLKYIACRGDVNMTIELTNSHQDTTKRISLFEYSLRKFVMVETDHDVNNSQKYFLISELLLLNGFKWDSLKDLNEDIDLTEDAKNYWKTKYSKLSCGSTSP